MNGRELPGTSVTGLIYEFYRSACALAEPVVSAACSESRSEYIDKTCDRSPRRFSVT